MAHFKIDTFADLHEKAVVPLVNSSSGGRKPSAATLDLEGEAFDELTKHREALSKPLAFRQRDDNLDLSALARFIAAEHPRLTTDLLTGIADEVSRSLRLHQEDSCALVDRALDLTQDVQEVPRASARIFYKECHHLVLCLHEMAQNLLLSPPDRTSIALFAMLGGRDFPKALFQALVIVLTDLTGGQSSQVASDETCVGHAGAMIQLLVETLFAFSFAFTVTLEDVEQTLSLLPHVVMAGHSPAGQGFTISDLDLILREEHADISIKLCLALVCMCQSPQGKLDISKVPANAGPRSIKIRDLTVSTGNDKSILESSPLGAKIKEQPTAERTGYWNEESQLGQFLCFAISGVILDEDRALRNGYVHWHVFHFLLHEVLLSPSMCAGPSRASSLVFMCLQSLLSEALLPVGRRWIAIRKLEAQAVAYGLVLPDTLQIAALRTLSRLCRAYPPACETFRDIMLNCTDTFHLSLPQVAPESGTGGSAWAVQPNVEIWIGAPPTAAGMTTPLTSRSYDNTALYAEILELLAVACGRGSLACGRHVCQKLVSHTNQWFNWSFLVDTVAYAARSPQSAVAPLPGGTGATAPTSSSFYSSESRGCHAPPVLVAVCHLISGVCSSRLCVSQPPPTLNMQAMQAIVPPNASAAEAIGALLLELLVSQADALVKAAALAAFARLDWATVEIRSAFSSLVNVVPSVLPSLSDIRSAGDAVLATEFLACALQLAQSVPLRNGRHALDLQAITHVVVHYICLKVLADPSLFSSSSRYWRLATLALRWIRLILRGPISLAGMALSSDVAAEAYGDLEGQGGNQFSSATEFMFCSLLSMDSPVFAHVMYLTLLQGHGITGLLEKRQASTASPFMEQATAVGLDVLRLLLQRDIPFLRLRGIQAVDTITRQIAPVEGSNLMPCHKQLCGEFKFPYPPQDQDTLSVLLAENPFAAKRVWHRPPPLQQSAAFDGGRTNPSYLMLLAEFVGASSSPLVSKLALYVFAQCSLRDPQRVYGMLQLEPWRLQCLSSDLHDRILSPEEDTMASILLHQVCGEWKAETEECFMFEAAEIDAPADVAKRLLPQLDVASFQTCIPCCFGVDIAQQLADDSLVQMADLDVWSRNLAGLAASADQAYFEAAHLQGLSVLADSLPPLPSSVTSSEDLLARLAVPPPAPLGTMTCRVAALRALVLLQGDDTTATMQSAAATKLAHTLLGFDFNQETPSGRIDVDEARAGQGVPITAVMGLLEHPPEFPVQTSQLTMMSLKRWQFNSAGGEAVGGMMDQHSAYELALRVFVGLFKQPKLRDAVLLQMCFCWPSRYGVLRASFSLPWSSMPPEFRRVLLAECCMLLRAMSWEMRLIPPAGSKPPADLPTDLASIQRWSSKQKVGDHLADRVRDFVLLPHEQESAGGGASSMPSHGEVPFLIATFRRLIEAYDPIMPMQEEGTSALQQQVALQQQAAGGDAAAGPTSTLAVMDVSLQEEILKAFAIFVSAALHHLLWAGNAGFAEKRVKDPGAQRMRAHLEALLLFFEQSEQSGQGGKPPRGVKVAASLAASFVYVMLKTEGPAPLSFMRHLFKALQATASETSRSPGMAALVVDVTMPLLAGLLARVPFSELSTVFDSDEQWTRLVHILRAVHAPMELYSSLQAQVRLRFSSVCVVGLLCRDPKLAATLFKAGALSGVLHPSYLYAVRAHIAPNGLPALDAPHPAALLPVLQTLSMLIGALPTHKLALQSVVTWLHQHQRILVDISRWVSRLPAGSGSSEPKLLSADWLAAIPGRDLGSVLRSAARVEIAAPVHGPERMSEGALLLLCSCSARPKEENGDRLAALALSGECWLGGTEATTLQGIDRDQVVALCYRCVAAFAELWGALCSAAQRWAAMSSSWALGPSLQSQIQSLEPVFEEILAEAMIRQASMTTSLHEVHDSSQNVSMGADGRKVEAHDLSLCPSDAIRVRAWLHMLHAWRCDSLTRRLQALSGSFGSLERDAAAAAAQLQMTGGWPNDGLPMPAGAGPGSVLVPPGYDPSIQGLSMLAHAQLSDQARIRASVLGAVFVRCCSDFLLGLNFAAAPTGAQKPGGDPLTSPCLQFQRSEHEFRQMLHIIEVSLHLLQLYLHATLKLTQYSLQPPQPIPGAPRTATVLQHLQALSQFSQAVSGILVLSELDDANPPLPARVVHLTFAAACAQRVEYLLSGM